MTDDEWRDWVEARVEMLEWELWEWYRELDRLG